MTRPHALPHLETRHISPTEWAQRIPWHPRSAILNSLDRAIHERTLHLADLDRRIAVVAAFAERLDTLTTVEAARAYVAARGFDPEGPARLALLMREVEAFAAEKSIRARTRRVAA